MKFYQNKLSEKSKSGGKNMSQSMQRAELIKIACQKIVKEKTCKLNFKKNYKKLKINNSCLIAIANVIKLMLEKIIDKNEFHYYLDDIIEKDNFSSVLSAGTEGKTLQEIIKNFKKVEKISFRLLEINEDESEINYILLFYYFYKVLFPNVNTISINFDIFPLLKIYNEFKNPYNFKGGVVKEISSSFESSFITNFLITCIIVLSKNALNLKKLKVKSSESFIYENSNVICKEFSNKNIREKISKEKGFILFKKLMKLKTMTSLSFSINCLDLFLFKEIINFIALRRTIESLELNLFYNPKFFNRRKIFLNYFKSLEFKEIDPNFMEKYGIVYFPYINKLGEDIQTLIEDEKIPDLLYLEFKKNLNNLKIILNQYIISFKEFSLDITPYEELRKHENYNVQILLFILVIMHSLENSKEIETLKLKCENFEYAYVSQILKRINKLKTQKLIDFSKCNKLKNLSLDIQGITLLLNFSLLPFNSLQTLGLSITALKDMEKLLEFFRNHKNDLKNLTQLNLSFLLAYDTNYTFKAFLKIFDNLPLSIKALNIYNENMMKIAEVLDIIQKILRNNVYVYNCEFKCDCLDLEKYMDVNKTAELKNFLNSKGLINIHKCEIITNQFKRIRLGFISHLNADFYKSIIFYYKKMEKNNENGKKIDSKKIITNILEFMGNYQNFDIILN